MTDVARLRLVTLGAVQSAREGARHPPSDSRSLTIAESQLLVERNTRGCVRYPRADGSIATSRVRYVRQSSVLYMPAWANVDAWYDDGVAQLECDVSEVDGHSCWRYVWLRGHAAALFPTGREAEREAWREAVAVLRRTFTNIGLADDLALANFGIVRLDVETWHGAIVAWE